MYKTIRKEARIVRKALRNKLSFSDLKDYIEDNGYPVMFIGSPDGDDFIERLGLIKHKAKRAFTYENGVKIIFIQHDLTEFEKLHCLLHELGHIKLGHIEMSSYEIDDITAETQAETFAFEVLNYNRRDNAPISVLIICAIVFVSMCFAGAAGYYNRISTKEENEIQTQETLYYADAYNVVHITPSGTHYHDKDCRYIGNNAISVDLAEVKDTYFPCSICQSK